MANLSHLPAQWRASGLSQRAFCEREGIRLATFAYWRAKERAAEAPTTPPLSRPVASPAAFAELVVSPAATDAAPLSSSRAIEIRLPTGVVISIPV